MFFSENSYGNSRGGRSQQSSYWGNSSSGFGATNGGGYKGGFNYGKNSDSNSTTLLPISKDNYKPVASVKARAQPEVDRWMIDNAVTVDGENVPCPVLEFEESTFPGEIVNLLLTHFQKPTPIQSISWPVALSGHDLISIAKTGSGKTLGFILPAIIHVKNQPKREMRDGPLVVVLLPTRELALQVEEVAKEYCDVSDLKAVCCYGGASKGPQARDLMYGVDICIATPGRLLDFLDNGTTNMRRCSYFVLDEADRMLDMGFEPQIRRIADQIRPDRQTLMFSATWPKDVRRLAADFHTNPVHLHVGSLDLSANHNILQTVECLEDHQKNNKLFELLDSILAEDDKTKTLIFVETKRKADDLTRWMRQDGWPALCIHGDKEQREREWVLAEFKASRTPILIATDVAARGLDVDDVKFVINFDYPNNSEDYVHRIGRTGRRDRSGTAITFFTPNNAPKARDLIKVLEEANQNVPSRLADFANGTFYEQNGFRSRRGGGDFTGSNSFPVGGGGGHGGSRGQTFGNGDVGYGRGSSRGGGGSRGQSFGNGDGGYSRGSSRGGGGSRGQSFGNGDGGYSRGSSRGGAGSRGQSFGNGGGGDGRGSGRGGGQSFSSGRGGGGTSYNSGGDGGGWDKGSSGGGWDTADASAW